MILILKVNMKKKFLDLGKQPLANSFLHNISKKNLKREYFYNLSVGFDKKNHQVSLTKHVNPKMQYTNLYAHRASQSQTMKKSFQDIALKLQRKFKPKLSMEIGSNDGVFLKNFNKKNIIAVEPCINLAKITKLQGYKTYSKFWTKKLAKNIVKSHQKLDLIFSANTVSHIPNLKETFNAIAISLSKDGILVIEDPYIGTVIKLNSYDQFYDEHVYVFSLLSITKTVSLSNLRLFDSEPITTHGGSMRYYICKSESKYKPTKRLNYFINRELKQKLNKFSTYQNFSQRVKKSKKDLNKLLTSLKKKKKKIIVYGATYKSTTILNYCNLGSKYFDYVIDTTPNKQGKFTPGKHIPIISPQKGFDDSVDYAFLGAWNFKKEIFKKETNFIKRGGKFITHIPKVRIV